MFIVNLRGLSKPWVAEAPASRRHGRLVNFCASAGGPERRLNQSETVNGPPLAKTTSSVIGGRQNETVKPMTTHDWMRLPSESYAPAIERKATPGAGERRRILETVLAAAGFTAWLWCAFEVFRALGW
jgi:hypothetical protein